MESSDLSKVFEKMGSLLNNFTNKLGVEMYEKFGKVGESLDKLSLTDEQKMELVLLYKKLSSEESSLLTELVKKGDKSGLKLLLSKHITDEHLINTLITSAEIWKESSNIGESLSEDITNVLKDIKIDNDNIFESLGKAMGGIFKGSGLEHVDMKQVKSMVGKIAEKVDSEELPNFKENVEKMVNSIDENLSFSEHIDSQYVSGNMNELFDKINEGIQVLSKKQIRQGLIDETVCMIEKHKKLSDDINAIAKTLTSEEIEILQEKCGELPLDFRLRMMENTIQQLDSKLSTDSEKSSEIEELSEKIDDIAVNLELLIARLSKLLQ